VLTASETGVSTPVVLESAAELSAGLDGARSRGATVGFVPTMGALHAGHSSLIERARAECYVVAVSVFVNPSQFNDPADLESYPRDPQRDIQVAISAGADFVFMPNVLEMYPAGSETVLEVPSLSRILEGASRPGHFSSVATVVSKLFAIAGRCTAYFGEKDFQQLQVIKRMATDLKFPVEVAGCATVREEDGLAMSSRNTRLSPDERYAAAVLYHALLQGKERVEAGERDPVKVEAAMANVVSTEPLAQLEYAVAVEPVSLNSPTTLTGEVRLLVAARFGNVRLIDNIGVMADLGNEQVHDSGTNDADLGNFLESSHPQFNNNTRERHQS